MDSTRTRKPTANRRPCALSESTEASTPIVSGNYDKIVSNSATEGKGSSDNAL